MHFPSILCGRSSVQPEHVQASSSNQAGAPRPPVRGQPSAGSPTERSALAAIAKSGRSRAMFSIAGMKHLICGNRSADHPLQAGELEQLEAEMETFIEKFKAARSPEERAFICKNMAGRLQNLLQPIKGRLGELNRTEKRQLLKGVHVTRTRIAGLACKDNAQILRLGKFSKPGPARKAEAALNKQVNKELENLSEKLERLYQKVAKTADSRLLVLVLQDIVKANDFAFNTEGISRIASWIAQQRPWLAQQHRDIDPAGEGDGHLSPTAEGNETTGNNGLAEARLEPNAALGISNRTQSSQFSLNHDSLNHEADVVWGRISASTESDLFEFSSR